MKALLNLNAKPRPPEREREAFRAQLRRLSQNGAQVVCKGTLIDWIARSAHAPNAWSTQRSEA